MANEILSKDLKNKRLGNYANVVVANVPAAPTIGTASGSSGSFTISYTNNSNNGSAILDNTAILSTGESLTGTQNPFVFTGLTNGIARTARVTARNANGSSDYSSSSNSIVFAVVPGAPTIGVATAGEGTISATFVAPISNGGAAITGYTATLSTGETATGSSSPITFSGLSAVARTVTVKATNSVGQSAASAASNSVTPTSAVVASLLAVTSQNRINNAADSGGTTATPSPRLGWVSRWNHVIGSGAVDKLQFSFDNWWGDSTTNTVLNTGNAFTINTMQAECNGVIVPVLFGGSRSKTVLDGEGKILSDFLYPAQFGLAQFDRAVEFWTKAEGTVPASGNKVPASARFNQDLTGCQFAWYSPAETTISSTDATGVYTATGTAFLSRTIGFCPIVLGTFIGGDKTVRIAKGDSITQGWGQTAGFKHGRGYFQRAMVDADGVSNPYASINMAVYGATSLLQLSDARIQAYDVNANVLLVNIGTNDFSTTGTAVSAATMITRVQNIRTAALANGITRSAIQQLGVRATSTDSWKAELDQTTAANWGAGGPPDVFNGLLSTAGYTAVFPNEACRGTVDRYKWLTNGTANYSAFDVVHPSGNGHLLKSIEVRPLLAALDL